MPIVAASFLSERTYSIFIATSSGLRYHIFFFYELMTIQMINDRNRIHGSVSQSVLLNGIAFRVERSKV